MSLNFKAKWQLKFSFPYVNERVDNTIVTLFFQIFITFQNLALKLHKELATLTGLKENEKFRSIFFLHKTKFA